MRTILLAFSCAMFFSCAHQNRITQSSSTMTDLPIALPHGAIETIVDDVFYVMGSNVIVHDGVRIEASRTMTIIREHGELTLVNTIRLSDAGIKELEKLGRIKNIIRLGAFHGRDDAFYQRAYGATLWEFPEMERSHGEKIDRDLRMDHVPIANARVIEFTSTRFKEAALMLQKSGGILITCDSIKNWQTQDAFFDDATFAMMKTIGSIGAAVIDKTWLDAMQPTKADLRALSDENFTILVSAHGAPLMANARDAVRASISKMLPSLRD